jgi:hypothetical protein
VAARRPRLLTPWFHARVLLDDDEALGRMTGAAAMAYRRATGRLGGTTRDTYWRSELWERFTEPGRAVGLVTPESLGGRPRARAVPHAERDAPPHPWDPGRPASRWPRLEPRHDVEAGIPPGWCLVHLTATLDVESRAAHGPG